MVYATQLFAMDIIYTKEPDFMKNDGRKIDLRVKKTRAAIKNTFKDMICEMNPFEITIKELAERAQIHRKTFYLHYTSIEALFEDMLGDIADAYYKKIDAVPLPMPMLEVNRVFFEFLAHSEPYIERLICAPEYQDFCNKAFQNTFLQHNRSRYNPYAKYPQEEQNLINTFLSGSSINMYRQWVLDGKKIPLERLIKLSGELLTFGVDQIAQ